MAVPSLSVVSSASLFLQSASLYTAEHYTRKRYIVPAGFHKLYFAVLLCFGCANGKLRRCDDLCGGGAEEYLLQAAVCRNVSCNVIYAAGVHTLGRYVETLPCRRCWERNGERFASAAGIARNSAA